MFVKTLIENVYTMLKPYFPEQHINIIFKAFCLSVKEFTSILEPVCLGNLWQECPNPIAQLQGLAKILYLACKYIRQ